MRTGLAVRGMAEFHAATLHRLADVSMVEAWRTVLAFAEQELGCAQVTAPDGEYGSIIRLCRECAQKTGAKVADLGGDHLPLYDQETVFPDGLPDPDED